jgi:hypothetical protein
VKWCSRQVLAHGHRCTCTGDALNVVSLERRLQRLGLRERRNWSLQPVMLRQDRFTKTIGRLLHGG